ncbi:MAG TPA: 2OG-Fe(II) oxygenase [Stellaceae bacterium]|nr:2OG-Fe(II) oxygenase [Stellaceae bacterium]
MDSLLDQFSRSLQTGIEIETPFRHWLLERVLPDEICAAIRALPFAPPAIADTAGKRETHNSTRTFFSVENRRRFAVCQELAETLQNPAAVERIEARCATRLGGSFLRIEYCQDTEGFWLEPHTDIGAKLFTMLIYLSPDDAAAAWGTDLMTPTGEVLSSAPSLANNGLVFLPGQNTWHGFRKRPIEGVRRSLIVNYVRDEWRSRHELAFPDRPVA